MSSNPNSCPSCNILVINGIRSHELGCPSAWKDSKRECLLCGYDFKPLRQYQRTCPDCEEEQEAIVYAPIDPNS